MTDDKEGERVTKESNQGRIIRKMAELKEHPDTRAAKLQEAEILALQLYTGAVLSWAFFLTVLLSTQPLNI